MSKLSKFNLIWAPWRIGYVVKPSGKGCFICKSASRGKNSLLVYTTGLTKVLLNAFPYNNGHLLVAPCRHKAHLYLLTEEERKDIFEVIVLSQEVLSKYLKPAGFNIGVNEGRVAGAGLKTHIHFHIVPRWDGDTNFMPVVAYSKIVPQSLRELRGILRKGFAKIKR